MTTDHNTPVRERQKWAVRMGAKHNSRAMGGLLSLLTSYCNAEGECFPGRKTLAQDFFDVEEPTESQLRRLDRVINCAHELDLVTVYTDHWDSGQQRNNRYLVHFPDAAGSSVMVTDPPSGSSVKVTDPTSVKVTDPTSVKVTDPKRRALEGEQGKETSPGGTASSSNPKPQEPTSLEEHRAKAERRAKEEAEQKESERREEAKARAAYEQWQERVRAEEEFKAGRTLEDLSEAEFDAYRALSEGSPTPREWGSKWRQYGIGVYHFPGNSGKN